MLEGIFNLLFGWVRFLGSPWDVLIISLIITFLVTLAYKFLTDQVKMKELKSRMKEIQEKMKVDRTNQDLQKEMWGIQGQFFKHSMKPMLFTFLPLILIFNWMRVTFDSGKDIIEWSVSIPLFGTGLGWLGVYIISSIIFSTIVRKIMKVH